MKAKLLNLWNKGAAQVALMLGMFVGAGSAMAADPDVSAITTIFASAVAVIGTIGVGYLGVLYGKKLYVWLKPS